MATHQPPCDACGICPSCIQEVNDFIGLYTMGTSRFHVYVEDQPYAEALTLEGALVIADSISWELIMNGADIFCEDTETGQCYVYTSVAQCPSVWASKTECLHCYGDAFVQKLPDGTGFGFICHSKEGSN